MDYIPRKRAEKLAWWQGISDNIDLEGVKLGLTVAEIAAVKAIADDMIAKMEATDAAEAAQAGVRAAEKPATAANDAAIRAAVRNWKTLAGYAASGSEGVLQLRGSESVFDPTTFKTVLKVTIEGGQVKVVFTKEETDGVWIFARLRGALGWTKLALDTGSPYYDTRPLAVPGVPETREYMARGVVNDAEIGLDSDIVSITFAG